MERNNHTFQSAFTLVELLIVIAILGVIAAILIVVLNPAELLRETRDTNRVSSLSSLDRAIGLYNTGVVTTGGTPDLGADQTVYLSLPDTNADCSSYTTLPALDPGWSYACVPEADLFKIDGTGWIPVDFTQTTPTAISSLPIDPINAVEGGRYYTYVTGSWELTASLESAKYQTRYEGEVLQIGSIHDITPNAILARGGGGESVEYFVYGATSNTLRKIDASGNEVWSYVEGEGDANSSGIAAVAVDENGNVYTAGASPGNRVHKVDSDGNQVWSFTGHTNSVRTIAVDQDGNVYSGSFDDTVRKIDINGNQVWSFTGHIDNVNAVAVDQNGNVYSGSNDDTLRKLDSGGNELWQFNLGRWVNAVAVDQNGNSYIAGGAFDDTVRKIDPDGNQLWSFTGHTDDVWAVAVDQDGNVYSGAQDNTVRKIDANGNQVWSFTGHTSTVQAVAVDRDGNVYSGALNTLRKLDSDGNELWQFTTGSSFSGVAVDPGLIGAGF